MKFRLLSLLALLLVSRLGLAADAAAFEKMESLTAAGATLAAAATTTLDLTDLDGVSASDLASGNSRVLLRVAVATDNASTRYTSTLTFTPNTIAEADTIVIRLGLMSDPITFVGDNVWDTAGDFAISGAANIDAAAFAAEFNSIPACRAWGLASSNGNVATIVSSLPGDQGDLVLITTAVPASVGQVTVAGVDGANVMDKVNVFQAATATALCNGSTAASTGLVLEDGNSVIIAPTKRYLRLYGLSGTSDISVVRVR